MAKKFKKEKLEISDLIYLHDQVSGYFTDKWQKGTRNEGRWFGKNWTDEQEQDFKNSSRLPYSIPVLASKLQTISATQKKSRTSFKVNPAGDDPKDEVKAILAQIYIKDIERKSRFSYIESRVFDSGLAIQYGASKMYLDNSEIFPRVKVKDIDYKSLVWDKNSRQYDLSDALFMAEVEPYYRYQLEAEGIDTSNISGGSTGDWEGRSKDGYYVGRNGQGRQDYDIIYVFHHYQKVIRKCHYVIFPDSQQLLGSGEILKKFKSKKQAEEYFTELNIKYLDAGFPVEGSVESKEEPGYDYYKFVYNQILEHKETDLEFFPYNVYRALHFEDDFTSFMDFMQYFQLFIDRVFAQVDYSIGKDLKKVSTLNVTPLAKPETPASAMKKANEGGTILTKTNEEIFREYNCLRSY